MKGKMCKKEGGAAESSGAEGTKEERKEIADKKSAFKRGGKAKKHGAKVDGKKASARADKFKRGGHVKKAGGGKVMSAGGMSASSPLSGAGTKTASPAKNDKEDD